MHQIESNKFDCDDEKQLNVCKLDECNDNKCSHDKDISRQPSNTSVPERKKISWKMVLREILFFLALALTTYDALQNSPPKISRTPTPAPFFDKGSLVMDWYRGQLSAAFSHISMSEISFVMYYAPWDAESQHVRQEFDKVAQTMFKQVHFSAVNCWNPGGECRQHHNKISVWPIIMAYTTHLKSVIYTGPKDSASMVKFLRHVINPLRRLTSSEKLLKLITVCDAVVVGYTPMTDGPVHYNAVYSAALKSLKNDPFADVCFAVVTSEKLAEEMGVKLVPNLKLIMWNETLEYPSDSSFSEEPILNWIWSNVNKRVTWVTPAWQKSFSMQNLFSQGPVLLLFTPRNHYNEETPNYDLLRETALEYHSCGNPWIAELTKFSAVQRHKYIEYEQNKTDICREFTLNSISQDFVLKTVQKPTKVYKSAWLNKTHCKRENSNVLQSFLLRDNFQPGIGKDSSELFGLKGCCLKNEEVSCQSKSPLTETSQHEEEFSRRLEQLTVVDVPESLKTSMLDTKNDPRAPINLQQRRVREICIIFELAKIVHAQVFPKLDGYNLNIEGLACKTNHSLSFVAIDSLVNHHFAESLGIDISNKFENTAVVILDSERETQHILQKPFGEQSLREFVYNFTMNLLPRDLRTVTRNAKYTHYYGSNQNTLENNINDNNQLKLSCQSQTGDRDSICLYQLNTFTFIQFIMQKNKAIIVAFCGGSAGPCGGLFSMALMRAASALRGLGDQLQIARIDASRNDLPWEYTVSKYPTLVLFPAGKKEESRAYPENQAVTVEGVIAFILTGLEPPMKLHAQTLLCNQTQDGAAIKQCLMGVRSNTASMIGSALRQWRRARTPSVRGLLLRRLQHLRSAAIALGALNTVNVPPEDQIFSSFTEAVKSLTKLWNVSVFSLRDKKSLNKYNKSLDSLDL